MVKVNHAVISVLENSVRARNDDTYLISEVLKELGYPTDLAKLAEIEGAPAIEAIRRSRQRAQATYHKLRATEGVRAKRESRRDFYREIAQCDPRR